MSNVDPVQVENDAVTIGEQVLASPKAFWKSKTFWFNVLTIGLHYSGYIPPAATAPVLVAGNVALRLMSSGAVSLVGK